MRSTNQGHSSTSEKYICCKISDEKDIPGQQNVAKIEQKAVESQPENYFFLVIVVYSDLPNHLKQVNPAKYDADNDIEREEETKDYFCVLVH